MNFSNYGSTLKELHLYVSKSTPEREKIQEQILPILKEADEKVGYHREYSKNTYLEKTVLLLQNLKDRFDLKELPLVYGIVDYLVVTPLVMSLDLERFSRGMVAAMSSYLPQFPILHEVAVLCWYDQLIAVDEFLKIFDQYRLSEKECYHILGELSHRYPRDVIGYVLAKNLFGDVYLERIKRKMRVNRQKDTKKDFELVGTPDEIDRLWTELGKKV